MTRVNLDVTKATSLESSRPVGLQDGQSGRSDQVSSNRPVGCAPFGCGSFHVFGIRIRELARNGIFRDTVRSFIKGDGGMKGDFATRRGEEMDDYFQSGRCI